MTKEVALIQASQALLQFNDMQQVDREALEILLDIILPSLEEHNRTHLLCQCCDRQLDIDIDEEWNFDYETEREKIKKERNDA